MHSSLIKFASDYFDEQSSQYDNDFSDFSIWALAHYSGKKILIDALGDKRDLAVADVGCGTGKWSAYVVGRTSELLLSDVAESMLNIAKEKFNQVPNVKTLQASVENLSHLPANKYDLVLCMGDPLSYASDYESGVRELCRIAKPGGYIFLSVDSRLGYLRIIKDKAKSDLRVLHDFLKTGNIIGWEGLPIHAFTRAELHSFFINAGCEVMSIHSLPSFSSYFLFESNFLNQIKDQVQFKKMVEHEMDFMNEGSPGPHHLYGLFIKSRKSLD